MNSELSKTGIAVFGTIGVLIVVGIISANIGVSKLGKRVDLLENTAVYNLTNSPTPSLNLVSPTASPSSKITPIPTKVRYIAPTSGFVSPTPVK